jgi:hypothetical protein
MRRATGWRAGILASGVALALIGAGCEEAGQRGAREAVQAYLRTLPADGGYSASDVHCTHGGRYGYFQTVRTKRYFCTARLNGGGDCGLFRADALANGSASVTLVRRSAGCVLPAG